MKLFSLLLFISTLTYGQEYQLNKSETNTTSSFRGLSVVDNNVAWLSGTEGRVGSTTDGGISWNFSQVNGFEKTDFRSLYAFDAQRAVIANTGSPASILITTDAGKTWKIVYTQSHAEAFFDGIDFWNDKEGIIYGDPINGKMLMLRTTDGGLTWSEVKDAPQLEKGEASFAASGTGIQCTRDKLITICTGGAVSRLWVSKDKGEHWTAIPTPILQGESSMGIFSFIQSKKALIIVGGDYKNETLTKDHIFYSLDDGIHWTKPHSPTRGYRECIQLLKRNILLAAGPSGTDISFDNGISWKSHSEEKGLHVIRKARNGSLVIASGGKGQVFVIR